MSQTLGWRINRTKLLIEKYAPTLDVSEQLIQLSVHLSRNDVFRRYIPQREYLARKSATFNDGDFFPLDWLRYADNATSTYSGKTYPLELIPVEKIPFVKINPSTSRPNQPLFTAYATQPKIAFYDQKIHLFPSTITALVDYYWRPADLWKSDNSVALTTTDNMPTETEYAIVRGAAERAVALAESKQTAAEMMERGKLRSEQVALDWYREQFGQTMKDIKPLV